MAWRTNSGIRTTGIRYMDIFRVKGENHPRSISFNQDFWTYHYLHFSTSTGSQKQGYFTFLKYHHCTFIAPNSYSKQPYVLQHFGGHIAYRCGAPPLFFGLPRAAPLGAAAPLGVALLLPPNTTERPVCCTFDRQPTQDYASQQRTHLVGRLGAGRGLGAVVSGGWLLGEHCLDLREEATQNPLH